jgi:hypothetical protein
MSADAQIIIMLIFYLISSIYAIFITSYSVKKKKLHNIPLILIVLGISIYLIFDAVRRSNDDGLDIRDASIYPLMAFMILDVICFVINTLLNDKIKTFFKSILFQNKFKWLRFIAIIHICIFMKSLSGLVPSAFYLSDPRAQGFFLVFSCSILVNSISAVGLWLGKRWACMISIVYFVYKIASYVIDFNSRLPNLFINQRTLFEFIKTILFLVSIVILIMELWINRKTNKRTKKLVSE